MTKEWFSKHKRAVSRHFLSLLGVVVTELTSVCWRFKLSIGALDVVCTENAAN